MTVAPVELEIDGIRAVLPELSVALPDNGIDDLSARVTNRPCWLTVPGS